MTCQPEYVVTRQNIVFTGYLILNVGLYNIRFSYVKFPYSIILTTGIKNNKSDNLLTLLTLCDVLNTYHWLSHLILQANCVILFPLFRDEAKKCWVVHRHIGWKIVGICMEISLTVNALPFSMVGWYLMEKQQREGTCSNNYTDR